MSDKHSDPQAIEHDLAVTRARLAAHLDELSGRLSPGQLLDEGLSYLRDGQAATFVRNLGTQVRENPLPVTLAGIGLAWLAASSSMNGRGAYGASSRALVPYDADDAVRSSAASAREDLASRARRAADTLTRGAEETEDAFRARVAEVQAKVLGITRSAQDTAANFAERVQEALQAIQDKAAAWTGQAADMADRARSSASDAGATVSGQAREAAAAARAAGGYAADAGSRLAGAVADNPILIAALGMTAGALLGSLLPQTEAEAEHLGDAIGDLGSTARDAARDVMERGAEVVTAAANAGMQAARDQGLVGAGGEGGDKAPAATAPTATATVPTSGTSTGTSPR